MNRRSSQGRTAGSAAATDPRVVIDRLNQELLVKPRCDEALEPLRTAKHTLVGTEGGSYRVECIDELLGTFDDEPTPRPWYGAGLEPVLNYLLHCAGKSVTRVGDQTVELSAPAPPDERGLQVEDARLIDFVHRHKRGLIRRGDAVDPAWLVAQLRVAFPEARIAVAVGTLQALWDFGRRLKTIIPGATIVADDNSTASAGPLLVATFMGLGNDAVDLHQIDILIVLDAAEGLTKYAQLALDGAPRARLYGLLDRSRRLPPRDHDRVVALFGLDEVIIPRHGHVERPVEVVPIRITGGPIIAAGADIVGLKRAAIWHNPVRNRRLARLARAVARGDRGWITGECPTLAGRPGGDAGLRVVIVVESVEHALTLAERLDGWPIATGHDVMTLGLTPRRVATLEQRRRAGGGIQDRLIATHAGLDAVGAIDPDVVILADAGPGIPKALEMIMITGNQMDRPLLLFDLDDRHRPELRRRARRRRDCYLARGWTVHGSDVPTDPIGRFLAARPGRKR